MRSKPRDVAPRKSAKRLGPMVDAKLPYDKRTKATTKRASDAADKLLREMEEVLKHLDRKG